MRRIKRAILRARHYQGQRILRARASHFGARSAIAQNVCEAAIFAYKTECLFLTRSFTLKCFGRRRRRRYTDPTPSTARDSPDPGGRDVIGSAQTDGKKPPAFALPLLSRLGQRGKLRALVLEPTARARGAGPKTAMRDYGRFTDFTHGRK